MTLAGVESYFAKYTICSEFEPEIAMPKNMTAVLYLVAMITVIVSADFLFFRYRFWERLMVNIGIVLVFVAFYLRFLKHP